MGLASGETHIYIFFIPLSVGPWDSLVGEAYSMNVLKFSYYIVIYIHGTFRHVVEYFFSLNFFSRCCHGPDHGLLPLFALSTFTVRSQNTIYSGYN